MSALLSPALFLLGASVVIGGTFWVFIKGIPALVAWRKGRASARILAQLPNFDSATETGMFPVAPQIPGGGRTRIPDYRPALLRVPTSAPATSHRGVATDIGADRRSASGARVPLLVPARGEALRHLSTTTTTSGPRSTHTTQS